ncbi:BON domain-containing protein [Flavobacterium sp. MXW15]|uniref:BON domain-containing protein n=1 Tax=Xanthomonas chitinilytica TaxID=2989819 RepID=A0ABT3JT26_9XANT|nr:BON domain-containing protein [Xanthomonas sp. H13-6]MCW4455573.1 BON domain-containing protein [Flavobacterium sp. MXW15]MCW4471621.1 BON domain-containing protein [Xanthomonas sp. H13-6]
MSKRYSSRNLLASALALGLVLGAGPALANDPPTDRTAGESREPVSDSWITTKVKADLLTTRDVSGTEVKVETVNGVVTLSGDVDSQAERDRAVAVATGIEGVQRVDASGLRVVPTR